MTTTTTSSMPRSAITAWIAFRRARPARSTTGAWSRSPTRSRSSFPGTNCRSRRSIADAATAALPSRRWRTRSAALLEEARKGLGGKPVAPHSASKPTVNLYNRSKPANATVTGNFRLTACGRRVRRAPHHPGFRRSAVSGAGRPEHRHRAARASTPTASRIWSRLYSVASARDGEKPNANNLALTVKREPGGVCSNYLCDLPRGAKVEVTGPFGATFLIRTIRPPTSS